MLVKALFWHSAARIDPRWALALALPVLVVLGWNNLIGEFRPLLNFVLPTLVAIVVFSFAAVRLLTNPPGDTRASVRMLAVVSLIAAALWSARLLILIQLIPPSGIVSLATISVALAIEHLLVTVAGTFALLAVEVRSMEQELTKTAGGPVSQSCLPAILSTASAESVATLRLQDGFMV